MVAAAVAAAAKSLQSCPTLCDPMDCSPPGSSVRGIFQAGILEWVAISFSRGSSRPRDRTQVSRTAGRHFTIWATRETRNCELWSGKKRKVIVKRADFIFFAIQFSPFTHLTLPVLPPPLWQPLLWSPYLTVLTRFGLFTYFGFLFVFILFPIWEIPICFYIISHMRNSAAFVFLHLTYFI